MSLDPRFHPLSLSSLCASMTLSSSLALSPLPSSLKAPLSRLSSLQGRWSLLSRQERVVRDDSSPASLTEMYKMTQDGDRFYNLLELEVLRLRPGVWKLQFSGMDGPCPCGGPAEPWWGSEVEVMDVHDTSVLEGPTDELGFSELGPQTWVELRSGTLNTLWGVRHDGRNNEEESDEETGDELGDASEETSESEHIEIPAVKSVVPQLFQDTIQNFIELVNGIKVAVKKLIGFVDRDQEMDGKEKEMGDEENKMDDKEEEEAEVDGSLMIEDQESEEPIFFQENFHLVSLSLESEELVVKVQYGQRGEASKIVTLHYQSAGE